MKRLTFAFVIVLSLFVLGGCDQLLEGFFPYDTDTEQSIRGDAEYSVAVSIEYDFDLIAQGFGPGNTGDTTNAPIMVAFIPFIDSYDGSYQIDRNGIQLTTLWQNTFREDNDDQDFRTTVEFNTWNYATYKVLVWFDDNKDEDPGIDSAMVEPGTLAIQNESGDYWVDFRSMNPQNAGVQMSCRVGWDSDINVDQLTADPYADYGTGGSAPIAMIYSDAGNNVQQNTIVYFNSYSSYDPDNDWLEGWEWAITDQYSTTLFTSMSPEISYTFGITGPYQIKLRVKDNKSNWSAWTAPYDLYVSPVVTGTETTIWEYYFDTSISGVETIVPTDYYFPTGQYTIHWEDGYEQASGSNYTLDALVTCFDTYNPVDVLLSYADSGYTYPTSMYLYSDKYLSIKITPYSAGSTGTCRVWITQIQ